MAKGLYIQEGGSLDYRNAGAAIGYCDVVVLDGRIGIAESDIPAGGLGALSVVGVYELPAETGTAFTLGAALYWDATNGVTTTTATDNTPCGYAAAAKAAAATVAVVKIG